MVKTDTYERLPGVSDAVSELYGLVNDPLFQDAYIATQQSLARGAVDLGKISEEKSEVFDKLRDELERRMTDPKLVKALSAWGVSPSPIRGDNALDKPFNAGIVHYFEYPAIREKARRAGTPESPTLQGFIDLTSRLYALVGAGTTTNGVQMIAEVAGVRYNNEVVQEITRIKRTVLSTDGLMVVGFQSVGETQPKIITFIPGTTREYFIGSLNRDLEDPQSDQNRMNKLGPNRILSKFITISYEV